MKEVFWLEAGKVAGRAGPDMVPWDPFALKAGGIKGVLTVNFGNDVNAYDLHTAGLLHQWTPLSGNAPVRPGDVEHNLDALPEALAFIDQVNDAGGAVLVHCTHGKDRTGLMMAYWLMRRRQLTMGRAVARVREVRPEAFTAMGWLNMAVEVLCLVK